MIYTLRSRFVLIILTLFALAACAGVSPPSTSELSEVQAGQKVLVLFRVVGEDPDGKPLRAFKEGLVDDSVGLALGSPETGGVPKGRIERVRYLSPESRDLGWTYLLLDPGTYYLAVQPPRWGNLFTYLDSFKAATRWIMEIPPDAPLVYAGTLELYGIAAPGLVFGNKIFVAFDKQVSRVRDEERLAADLGAKHFADLGPVTTILMEPHHP